MHTLLLIAKAVALEEGAYSITLKHFEKALAYGKVTSERAHILLSRSFGRSGVPQAPDIIDPDSLIEKARQAPQIKIMPSLLELLRRLDAIGEEYFALHGAKGLHDGLAHVARIEKVLRANLLGHESVVDSLLSVLSSRALLKRNRKSVAGAYVFAGATACGKSLAARLLAEGLGEYPVMELDCSAFDSPNERFVFDGSPSAYAGARPGLLTTFVRENPRCVVVLDHFSRMNPALQTVLLPVLENGTLRDNYGFYKDDDPKAGEIASREVDFSQAHLILTTDVGAELYDHPQLIERLQREGGITQVESALADALRSARNKISTTPGQAFDPAVLSRILANGTAILFERLTYDALRCLCTRNLTRAGEMLLAGIGGGVLEMGANADELVNLLILSHGGQADARKFEIEALTRGFFAPLTQRWLKGYALNQVIITLPEADAMEVRTIMESLGKDPVRALFRQMKRVQFDVEIMEDANRISLVCRRPRLVKISSPADYHGAGALLMEAPEIRFDDIAGHEPVKAKLRQQIALLSNADALAEHGLRPPGGLLLYGPAGTGKTSIARALAGEADLPFIAVTAPELIDLSYQRRLFEKLRRYAPAILFIDEIDALGRRGGGLDPAINTLLAELDGFGSHDARVFVVGATNFPEKVDSALLRPGRIELRCEVGLPDRDARRVLLYRSLPDASDHQIDRLTDLSSGMSGAAMEAARRDVVLLRSKNPERSNPEGVAEAIEALCYGPRELMTDAMKERVAIHEAGHALTRLKLCPESDRVDCVSVISRGNAAGHVISTRNPACAPPKTRQRVKDELMILLAGRAAQVLHYGEDEGIDYGAASDLSSAVELATAAVIRWGMDPVLGTEALVMTAGGDGNMRSLPEVAVKHIDAWIKEADASVREFLVARWSLLEAITRRLIAEGALDHRQLVDLVEAGTTIQGGFSCQKSQSL